MLLATPKTLNGKDFFVDFHPESHDKSLLDIINQTMAEQTMNAEYNYMKITASNGKFIIIMARGYDGPNPYNVPPESSGFDKEDGKITRYSSTTEQPWVSANFTKDGKFVGGKTITKMDLSKIIETAEKNGFEIDPLAWLTGG